MPPGVQPVISTVLRVSSLVSLAMVWCGMAWWLGWRCSWQLTETKWSVTHVPRLHSCKFEIYCYWLGSTFMAEGDRTVDALHV